MSVTTQTLIWCGVQLAVVCGLSVLFARIAGRRNPSAGVWCLRIGIALALCVTLLAPFSLPSWFSFVPNTNDTASEPTVAEVDSASAGLSKPIDRSEVPSGTAALWEDFKVALMTVPAEPIEADVTVMDTVAEQQTIPTVLKVLAAGALVGVLWFMVGLVSVRRLLWQTEQVTDPRARELLDVVVAELRCTRKLRLIESEKIASAATIGFFRPVILLPGTWYDWTDDELHAVLAHEVAHVQANDFAATVFSQLVVAVHFLHPFVHYLSRQLRMFQELAADASASGLVGGRTNYATVLAGMALRTNNQTNLWATQAFLPAPRTMLRRIEMLRDANTVRTGVSRPARVLLTSALLLTTCAVVGLRANPIQQEGTPTTTVARTVSATTATSDDEKLSLDWVPNGSVAVVAMKPQALLNHEIGKPIAKTVKEQLQTGSIQLEALDSVTVCQLHPSVAGQPEVGAPRLAFGDLWIMKSQSGRAWKDAEKNGGAFFSPDESTLIMAHSPDAIAHIRKAGKEATSNRFWRTQWAKVDNNAMAAIVDIGAIRDMAGPELTVPPMFAVASPILNEGELAVLQLAASGDPKLSVRITTTGEKAAKSVTRTVEAAMVSVSYTHLTLPTILLV